ncbi:MAG TPA: YbdD/YjiX family protein [Rhodanobacteraceae bacterium]|nr:YbdD/YjiX family protein [Rhodanobacteraceae bacterium]
MTLRRWHGRWQRIVRAARRIAGIPDYDAYVEHVRARHPERPLPTPAAFFAERQRARYRGSGGRCC